MVAFLCKCAPPKKTEYLDELESIHQWLNNQKVTIEGSQTWPNATDQPEHVSLSHSDGVAGKLIFYLQLYRETNNDSYLQEATNAADYILANLPQKTDSLHKVFWGFSPYGNVCGSAFALVETYKATADEKYKSGATHVIDVIQHFALNKEDTISWGLGNDVLGGLAGTALFLLYAGENLERPDLIEMAEKAGKTLLSRATKEAGLSWKRGQNGRFELPNFSHGAAGIGYFFARLYETTDSESYLEAALTTNTYLESIAKTEDGVFLIPYGFPDPGWSRPYDVGWAHGPAGVARFYYQLFKVTGDEKWKEREQACLKGIMSSGIPALPSSTDFGEDEFYLDNRFGIGSVASFLLDIEGKNGEDEVFQNELIAKVMSESVMEGNQRYWPQVRYSFMANAGDSTAFTGLFYGAAGYGMLLLKAQAKMNGTDFIRFVDDPY